METIKKYSDTELEITVKEDKTTVESLDTTLALIAEIEFSRDELNDKLEPLYARRDFALSHGIKTKYEIDEENRLAEEARKEALRVSLDEGAE